MSIDEFIERLEELKEVEGITGDTDVVMAYNPNTNSRWPQRFEMAIAEAMHVASKEEVGGQTILTVKKKGNSYGLVVAVF